MIARKKLAGVTLRGSSQQKIYDFLAKNRLKAYRQIEIIRATGIPHGAIYAPLNGLAKKGLIEHKAPYWTVKK